jgi:hypothetical protein
MRYRSNDNESDFRQTGIGLESELFPIPHVSEHAARKRFTLQAQLTQNKTGHSSALSLSETSLVPYQYIKTAGFSEIAGGSLESWGEELRID